MHRYSAKLLFQYRVEDEPPSLKIRLCEERTIHFPARSDREALAKAKRKGKRGQYHYPNSDKQTVHFEFVGVLDLLGMVSDDPEEVWYDIKRRKLPMERRSEILPSDDKLLNNT